MPTPTYVALATTTLSSASSSVTFSSIPADYRDLVLIVDGTTSTSAAYEVYFNASGTGYTRVFMYGDGSNDYDAGDTSSSTIEGDTTFFNAVVQVMDYSATDKQKTTLSRGNTNGLVLGYASRWANTAAINQIEITRSGQTISSGTTLSLYGIEA